MSAYVQIEETIHLDPFSQRDKEKENQVFLGNERSGNKNERLHNTGNMLSSVNTETDLPPSTI